MNVGCRTLDVHDAVQGARVPVRMLYPTQGQPRTERFGAYTLDVAPEAPVAGERLSLVAISHGTGGTPWAYRGLAAHLARNGFAVLMIEHPGNTRGDDALAGTPANLANRPRHVRLALDAALADPHVAPAAAVIGHSMGGYTALACAGGKPMALPGETADGVARPVEVAPDPRVRACVLLAPALPWFMAPGALADVRVPLYVRTGERDDMAPPFFVERILAGVAMDYEVVRGGGHFSFMSPFPAALANPSFPPSQDPPGFDRAAYQERLADEVLAFLTRDRTR